MIELNTIPISVGIGTRSGAASSSSSTTRMDIINNATTTTGTGEVEKEPASIYEEQQKLECILDEKESDESSGEDPIPEEIILNSSSESLAATDAPSGSTTVAPIINQDEGASASSTAPIAKEGEVATLQSVATNSETVSSGSPVNKDTPAPNESMEGLSASYVSVPVPSEYYAIHNARKLLRTIPNLNGGYPAASPLPGKFFSRGDTRENITHITYDMEAKQCSTTSFDSTLMSCHCCGKFLAKVPGQLGRQTFVVSDQNFLAALPSDRSGSKCLKVFRIEGGGLLELADKFISIMEGWTLPAGSLILLGSLSHLAAVGLAAYIEDLCAAVNRLANAFRRVVNVAPVPFIFAEDTSDQSLIRSVVELYAWIGASMKQCEGLSATAFQVALEGINYSGSGATQADFAGRYRLPVNPFCNESQIWSSSGLSGLPTTVKKFESEVEAEIIGRLIADLNAFLALDLQPKPYYYRDAEKSDMVPSDLTTYILVGGSHALRTANALARCGKKAIAATVAGWRPTQEMTGQLLRKIERALELCPDKSSVVAVFQMYDNCSYFARADDGSMAPAKKLSDGKYHMEGASILAPKESQYVLFKKTLPILESVADLRKVVLAPLPRYLEKKCCSSPKHVTNFGEESYKSDLENYLYESKNNLRSFSFRHGIRNVRIIGSWHLLKKMDGIFDADPVHLTNIGYDKLAQGVIEAASELLKKRGGEDHGGSSSKRPRREEGNNSQRNNEDRDRPERPRSHTGGGRARGGKGGSGRGGRHDNQQISRGESSWQVSRHSGQRSGYRRF